MKKHPIDKVRNLLEKIGYHPDRGEPVKNLERVSEKIKSYEGQNFILHVHKRTKKEMKEWKNNKHYKDKIYYFTIYIKE